MEIRHNEEYHYFIDELAERRFYGNITLYFQNGNIQDSCLVEKNTKNEVREMMGKRKDPKEQKSRRTMKAVYRPKNGGAA